MGRNLNEKRSSTKRRMHTSGSWYLFFGWKWSKEGDGDKAIMAPEDT